ncbi:MAG TPA: DUF5709 domain-containing protein [Propionibacteriaceae bacterium]|jgi:hypothetical protein
MTESDETVPEQSEQLDLQPEEMLLETGRDDMLDGGYEVPDHWSAGQGFGNTPEEQAEGETLEQRLMQEEPEVSPEAYGAGLHEEPTGTRTNALDSDVTQLDLVGQEDLDNVAEDEHASIAGGSLEAVLDPKLDDLEDDPEVGGLIAGSDYLDDGEVGDEPVVGLVDPNEGIGEDTESQLVGLDSGGSSEQSAEEAAIHVVPES